MPLGLVKAAFRMMPRLQAEEALQEVTRIAYGSGHLEKDAARDVLARWKDAAGIKAPKPVRATTDALAAIGIGLRQG